MPNTKSYPYYLDVTIDYTDEGQNDLRDAFNTNDCREMCVNGTNIGRFKVKNIITLCNDDNNKPACRFQLERCE